MNLRRLVEQLKEDEGYRGWSYFDNDQHSWGFGTKAPGPDRYINKEAAEIELWQRAALAIRDYYIVFRYTVAEINDCRQEAFANMLYNLGLTKFVKFRNMLAAVDAGAWHEVSAQAKDSRWYKQVGKRAERIVNELMTGKKEVI